MRKAKKTIAIGLSLALMVSGIVMPSTESQAASKVKLNKTVATITVGKKLTLKVKRTKKKVKWSSSKKAIASVTKKGVVTGKKVGKATITAKVGKKKYKCKVTVKAKAKKTTAAKKTTTKVTPTPNGNVVNVTETAKPVESVKPVESMEPEETAKPEESVKPTQNPETEGLTKAELELSDDKTAVYDVKNREEAEYAEVPEGITSISMCAFSDCNNLKFVILPNTLTKIGWEAFMGCKSLEKITLPLFK